MIYILLLFNSFFFLIKSTFLFSGLPEKEENVNKANNSKTYVELGIDESNYHTSNLCGANYMPETPIISHHRKHLYE
jgi:hypothetical protein